MGIKNGTAIADISKQRVKKIQDWMNQYSTRILEGQSAQEAFKLFLTASVPVEHQQCF